MKGIIICGFPGVGKSMAATKTRDIEDAESSLFKWHWEMDERTGINVRRQHPLFPNNYVDYIEKVRDKQEVPYILVACHNEVRAELNNRGLPYCIVAPKKELREEYMARYIKRRSKAEFIESMWENWDEWLDGLEKDGVPIIHLGSGEYIENMLVW